MDGRAENCAFKQPIAVCSEFQKVIYLCDAQTNSIKILTPLSETVNFLRALGKLYGAFSVHRKGQLYTLKSSTEAISLVTQCNDTLDSYTEFIRKQDNMACKSLNGPQGFISSATKKSIDIMLTNLQRLKSITDDFEYKDINFLSLTTLDIEHLNATNHIKHPLLSKQEYARDFANTINESLKRITSLSYHYYTTKKKAWYPTPDHCPKFHDIPRVMPLPQFQWQTPTNRRCANSQGHLVLPFARKQIVNREQWRPWAQCMNISIKGSY